jgi:hypothetical protein
MNTRSPDPHHDREPDGAHHDQTARLRAEHTARLFARVDEIDFAEAFDRARLTLHCTRRPPEEAP